MGAAANTGTPAAIEPGIGANAGSDTIGAGIEAKAGLLAAIEPGIEVKAGPAAVGVAIVAKAGPFAAAGVAIEVKAGPFAAAGVAIEVKAGPLAAVGVAIEVMAGSPDSEIAVEVVGSFRFAARKSPVCGLGSGSLGVDRGGRFLRRGAAGGASGAPVGIVITLVCGATVARSG